jgi:hypothetical protein
MSALGDPADKQLDAHAADNFGGKDTSHRAGYGEVTFEGQTYTKMEWILRAAKRGHTLAAGESTKLVAYYEQLLEEAHGELSLTRLANEELQKRLTAAHQLIHDLEDKIAKQRTAGAVFDPDGSIGFAWAANRLGSLTAADHIEALEDLGASRGKMLGLDVLFLPPSMIDNAEHP